MKTKKSDPKDNRKNFARTEQEIPLFPYRPVNMASDDLEQAQNDFVQQAGMPSMPPNADHEDQQKLK
ncbi:MAG: hypothetical protein ABFS17_05700 [Chloroflexota bacterium]